MADTSTRSLWKGAITFGLVHIPIGLYSATAESGVDFDWLDRRTLDPVGYKRVNKRTGREVQKDDIVKGVEHGKGEYVVLSADEIEEAFPRTTQTIEIEAFVDVAEVPFLYLEKPYYTAPINKGERVYALLREALRDSGKAGLGRVVIRNKQHLAVILPCGPALVLNLLRWGGEVRTPRELNLPPQGKAAGLKPSELKMARHLIDEMTGHWSAAEHRDAFRDAIMKLVAAKAKAGDTATVEPMEEPLERTGAEVVDLTELLRRSLRGGSGPAPTKAKPRTAASTGRAAAAGGKDKAPGRKTAARKPAAASTARKAPPRKAAARKSGEDRPAARSATKSASKGRTRRAA